MAGKRIKFRADSKNRIACKETVLRTVNVVGKRVNLTVGLNKDFNLSNKYTMQDNFLVLLEDESILTAKKGKGAKAVYYALDEISYFATITIQFNKKNKVTSRVLTLYQPQSQCNFNELYCKRVTSLINSEKREEILDNIINYALCRI